MRAVRTAWPLSVSIGLGLGAALFLLAAAASAAPPPLAAGQPAPAAQCFARDDSHPATVYSSADSAAVRQAVAAAVYSDLVRLAGTCGGVAAQLGTTQTVAITRPLALIGGFAPGDWTDTFPVTQPTTLDSQNLGRVITASADITLGAVTVQHGNSFGHDGGGIFAGGGLNLVGAVQILSNTTVVSLATDGASPQQPQGGGGNGGGAVASGPILLNLKLGPAIGVSSENAQFGIAADFEYNAAGGNGGGLYAIDSAVVTYAHFFYNHAGLNGGGADLAGPLQASDSQFDHNTAANGAGFYSESSANLQRLVCQDNIASFGGGCGAFSSFQQVSLNQLNVSDNHAQFGGGFNLYHVLGDISQSTFSGNGGAQAGGALYFVDANGRLANLSLSGNSAPEGQAVAGVRFLSSGPLHLIGNLLTLRGIPFAGRVAAPGAVTVPAVLTGSAVSAAGVGIGLTDTILSGYALDLQTDNSPSSTIGGDYNLFDATPVISGTGIVTGTHSLVGNAQFADAAGHLSAASTAIDHGLDVGISLDLEGHSRPSGHGFDIGAFEYQFPKLFLPLAER